MTEKILGYFLLISGILIIFFSALNAFNIITQKTKPINFVKQEDLQTIVPDKNDKAPGLGEILDIPTGSFDLIINIGIQLLLIGIIMKAGFHLAYLGTMLVRPIVVDLNAKLPKQK